MVLHITKQYMDSMFVYYSIQGFLKIADTISDQY